MMQKLKTFGETTSIKGLPLCIKAKSLPIRLLWGVSVTLLTVIGFLECTLLILEYLVQTQSARVRDVNVFRDYHEFSDLFYLPGVTVCNQNPLTAYNGYEGLSWGEYQELLAPLASDPALVQKYFSPRGYMESLGPEAIVQTEAVHEFMIECSVGALPSPARAPCPGRVTRVPSVQFSQCHSVTLPPGSHDVLSVTLYLDEVNAPMLGEYSSQLRATRGVAVIIHAAGQMPDTWSAQFAPAGHLTTFTVSNTLYERLPDAQDPCLDASLLPHIHDLAATPYNYSQSACAFEIIQSATMETCGCMNPDSMILPASNTTTLLHFCGALSDNYTRMIEELECVDSVMADSRLVEEIADSCIVPCEEIFHSVSVSSSSWLPETAQLAFYRHSIRSQTFAQHFQQYEAIHDDYQATKNATKAVNELQKLSLINKNFARIEVVIPEVRAQAQSAVYPTSFEALLAGIGGNLNLCCGISVIVVVELMDLCIKLLLPPPQKHTRNRIDVKEINTVV